MLSQFLWFNFWQSWKNLMKKRKKSFNFGRNEIPKFFGSGLTRNPETFFETDWIVAWNENLDKNETFLKSFRTWCREINKLGKKLYTYFRLKTCHGRDLQIRWVASWVEIQFGTLKNKMEVSSFEYRLGVAI